MEENKNELKSVEWTLRNKKGKVTGDLDLISFVSSPAIQTDYKFFSDENSKLQKSHFSEERMEVTGPAMIPNKNILRVDENGEYFYAYFSENTVRECAQIYAKNMGFVKSNVEHGEVLQKNEIKKDECYVFETWIVEDENIDKARLMGFEVPKGTWMVTYKIENESLWKFLKEFGGGFSVEGVWNYQFSKIEDDILYEQIKSILENDEYTEEQMFDEIEKLNLNKKRLKYI